MKIVRASRLFILMPGLILALLLFTVVPSNVMRTGGTFPSLVPSAAAQTTPQTTVQETTLNGTTTSVAATAAAPSGSQLAVQTVPGVTGTITEFGLSTGALPQLMAAAPDGSIFYAQAGSNKIGQIAAPSSAGTGKLTVKEFTIPTAGSFPEGIMVAADGTVWFTEQNAHQIAKLDPQAGVVTEYHTPTANSGPVGITSGPDNNIWFTEAFANKVGVLDPGTGKMQDFAIPTPVSAPLYITSGPDGALWFVGVRSHKLGRIDPTSHAIVEFPLPTAQAGPTSLVVGPDGALWVTEFNADKIARFDVKAGKFTDEIPVASHKNGPRSGPGILVNGTDGNIWFTETFGNQIGRLNPATKQVQEFAAPTTSTQAVSSGTVTSGDTVKQAAFDANMNLPAGQTLAPTRGPGGIVFSQDGTIWFTAIFTHSVARLVLNSIK